MYIIDNGLNAWWGLQNLRIVASTVVTTIWQLYLYGSPTFVTNVENRLSPSCT